MSALEAGREAAGTLTAWTASDRMVGIEIAAAFGRTWILLPRADAERLAGALAAAPSGFARFRTAGTAAGHSVRTGPEVARTAAVAGPAARAASAEGARAPGEIDAAVEAAMAELFGGADGAGAADEGVAARRPRPVEMGAWDVPDDVPEWGAGGLVAAAVVAGWALAFGGLGFDSGAAWALAFGGAVVGSAAWIFARMEG